MTAIVEDDTDGKLYGELFNRFIIPAVETSAADFRRENEVEVCPGRHLDEQDCYWAEYGGAHAAVGDQ